MRSASSGVQTRPPPSLHPRRVRTGGSAMARILPVATPSRPADGATDGAG
jgi:hypothetical protein